MTEKRFFVNLIGESKMAANVLNAAPQIVIGFKLLSEVFVPSQEAVAAMCNIVEESENPFGGVMI